MKVDWSNFYILHNCSTDSIAFDDVDDGFTEIKPHEYLKNAKKIFNSHAELDNVDKINIISNVKRFIDCRCENILKLFGYNEKITDRNYPELKDFFKGEGNNNINFIGYLSDLNMILIEEVRKLRNIIEHDYKLVKDEDVKRAIAVAELFAVFVDSKFHYTRLDFIEIYSYHEVQMEIHFVKDVDKNEAFLYLGDKKYSNKDKEFAQILRIVINGNYHELPNVFGQDINRQFINFKEHYDEDMLNFDMGIY